MCAATATNLATTVPPTAGHSLCALKSNYQHLIHQLEIVCNGKTVDQMQPFISVAKHFQLLSQMSATDLKSNAISLGLSEVLDNEKSVQWNTQASVNAPGGIGLANNRPFISSTAPTLTFTSPGAAIPINTLYQIGGTVPPASTENQLYLNKLTLYSHILLLSLTEHRTCHQGLVQPLFLYIFHLKVLCLTY
jgi:hypothetical protein